jgi:hypothetical protein
MSLLLPCRQIQELLVSLKDKEASFIGSSKWIGAIELSYILDEYLGVTSKVCPGFRVPDALCILWAHQPQQRASQNLVLLRGYVCVCRMIVFQCKSGMKMAHTRCQGSATDVLHT